MTAELETSNPHAGLLEALLSAWGDLTVHPPADNTTTAALRKPKEPVPQNAYLLFNRWEDNALAQAVEQQFPQWARDRFAVPDSYFSHREARAPQLLQLPAELILPTTDKAREMAEVRHWLTECLQFASRQMHERLTVQDFCGVVLSPAPEKTIGAHWVALGDQHKPFSDEHVLFRYHDPRVMQRVWPALSPAQQARWLGPVTQWWSLVQPWGPYAAEREAARWFTARVPRLSAQDVAAHAPRDLLDADQWLLANISPAANATWRSYADNGIPPANQPDEATMLQLLADASRLKLEGANIEDYIWITWVDAPGSGEPHLRDWRLPHLAPTWRRIEDALRRDPQARLGSLFVEATRTAR